MIDSSWARNTQHLRVAIVDHDGGHADALERALRLAGHESHRFLGGEPLLRALHPIHGFDAFVLEWELPDISGPNLIRAIHERPSWRAPVLFTSTREREEVVAYALRLGADGYLIWPIRGAEFVARLEAIVRRGNGRGERKSEHLDNYLIDFDARLLYHHNHAVMLTEKEFNVAVLLLASAGRLLSQSEIVQCAWGMTSSVNWRTVQAYISRLRTKLELTQSTGWRLISVYRRGYRLEKIKPEHRTSSAG